MTARPTPESFTTLEAAQAEIARCHAELNRAESLLGGFEALCLEVKDTLDARAKLLGGQQ